MGLQLVEEQWQVLAACRGPNQVIFYPPARLERRIEKRRREQRAKEICQSCRVRDSCLSYSLEVREQHGIWGGLTENERRETLLLRSI